MMFAHVASLLAEGDDVEVRVSGNSMFPTLRSGSRIVLRPLREGDVRRGAIVLARLGPDCWVVHRILRAGRKSVVLMGDGNIAAEERVGTADIFGCMRQSRAGYLWGLLWLSIRPVRRIFIPAMYVLGVLKR